MLTKKELRKKIREEKARYDADALLALSRNVTAKLAQHPAFRSARTILAYYSLPDEVETHAFIQQWAGEKNFLLPVIHNGQMQIKAYRTPEQMVSGGLGISEPTGHEYTAYDKIDLVVVPGMAFNREGYRLGRGKGYYDRFLPLVPGAIKIGICFPFQLVKEIPCDENDYRMDDILF